jgi:imidazolonepropionase-like amidohydrolase
MNREGQEDKSAVTAAQQVPDLGVTFFRPLYVTCPKVEEGGPPPGRNPNVEDLNQVQSKRPTLALRCGRLIDGHKLWEQHLEQCVIVILAGNRIHKVGWENEVEIPEGVEVLDFSKFTVLPGLIDCHAHPLNTSENYQIAHLRESSAYKALKGLRVVGDMLQCGWTTIRIAGDSDIFYAQFDIRKVIREGMFLGPRITGAGHYLSITGGGGDIHDLAPEQHCFHPDGKIVDGVEAMRKAVREEIQYGSDWIKLLVTGAYMSTKDDPTKVHFSNEEMCMAVAEARRLGKHVMAHAHSAEGIKQAVLAGVRSIEHGTFIDEEGIRLMKEKGTWLVPTQYIGVYYSENADPKGQLGKMLEIQKRTDDISIAKLRRAVQSGVKVAVGTDCAGWDVSLNVLELDCLVHQLGMTELEAIRAATICGAELLGWDDEIGSIEPGKLADILVVDGDPLKNISCLRNVACVIFDGRVVQKTLRFF